jgi:hypothetical protein
MRSTVDSTKVGLSAGARVFEGPLGAPESALRPMGLLGADATLNIQQTTREKMDRYPKVTVVKVIDQQSAELQCSLHEMSVENLTAAFGLEANDIEAQVAGDLAVNNHPLTFDAEGNAVLPNPVKAGVAPVVTDINGATYVAGSDYLLIPRDSFGRSVLFRLSAGAIPAQGSILVDYTYTRKGRVRFPIGSRSTVVERKVKVEEEYTNGQKLTVIIYRATFSINGSLTLNTDGENGMSLPVTVSGLYEPSVNRVVDTYLE